MRMPDKDLSCRPRGKVSDALLEFAEPLLQQLPEIPPRELLESALAIAWTAWNAVVRADFARNPSALIALRAHLGSDPVGGRQIEALIERKRRRYSECAWYFGDWAVIETPQGHRLRVECRAIS